MTLKKIAWVVDSTAYVNSFLKNHPDVFEIPLNIHFGQQQFIDGIDLTSDQLYERIRNGTDPVKTSQPSAGEFAEVYTNLSKEYESIIAIHVSNSLSGTISSSISGAKIAEVPMECVDSLSLSAGITGLVEKGLELQAQGLPFDEIAALLRKETSKFRNYILIGNLTQLYKGGRLSSAQFYLGSLLKIKPIIQINKKGELQELDKVRSQKKAVQYLIDRVGESVEQEGAKLVYIMHSNALTQAESLKEAILLQTPHLKIEIGEISTVLAVHAGEETLAVLWYVP
ncbi:DegV family protein [Psychrobacillus sp. NEAU-3TGS]|uniref:DegV family protein n=1 Tax=Psychrobacillus sp. NEAU-3TGS TaxID=2995412 RepID=UPI002499A597|nr:DegV family protein [Psychrobacillus sp. NEAU-3TGS]MDI2587872.1 DegV family protein [Psychrobacillus sp. NEAU-3TGS]